MTEAQIAASAAWIDKRQAFFARAGVLALLPPLAPPSPTLPCVSAPTANTVGLLRVPEGLFRGIEQNGRVVAWAAAGLPREGVRAVTVETQKEFRGQGLAVQALLHLLQAANEPLVYLVEQKNAASLRCAQKAGFTLYP